MTERPGAGGGSDAGSESRPRSAGSGPIRGRAGATSPLIAAAGDSATEVGGLRDTASERTSNTRPDLGPPPPGVQPVDQPGSGLGLVASIVVAAVVFVLSIYAQGGDPRPERLPLAQTTGTLFWTVAAVAVIGAGAAAQYAERTAARAAAAMARPRSAMALGTAWIVPAVATAAAVLLVATYHNTYLLVVGPLIAFLGNAGALLARDLLDDASESGQRTAAAVHALVVLLVAFLALSAVYLNKMPTAAAAPLIALIGGLLTLETLERGDAPRETRLLYAGLAGLAMGQMAAALNWWPTFGWPGGAVLFVGFYLASGVLLARTQRSAMRGRDLVEFGAVSLVAFLILAVVA